MSSGVTNRQVTEIIREPGGATVQKTVRTYLLPDSNSWSSPRHYLVEERTGPDSMDDATLKDYLRESHRLASLNLTKKLQRELGLNPR